MFLFSEAFVLTLFIDLREGIPVHAADIQQLRPPATTLEGVP